MREGAFLFGKARSLVGVITDPPEELRSEERPAIIFLNAGLVHRVGPNRLYVKIARALSRLGFVALRFDFSGIGDSDVRNDHLPFEKSAISETQEAMSYLQALRGSERFVLAGLCSGAFNSFRTACDDPRVAGAVLINAQGFGGEDVLEHIKDKKVASDYRRILFQPGKWMKFLAGKANYRKILETVGFQLKGVVAGNKKVSAKAKSVAADFRSLINRDVPLLLVYSEGDIGLDYLDVLFGNKVRELTASGKLRIEIIPRSDHTATLLRSQNQLVEVIQDWVRTSMDG